MQTHDYRIRSKVALGLAVAAAVAVAALSAMPGEADATAIPVTSSFDPIWATIDAGSLTTMYRPDPAYAIPTEVLWASVEAGVIVLEDPSD